MSDDFSEDVTSDVAVKVKRDTLYQVIFLNDNLTHYEFVISVLIDIYNYDFPSAEHITSIIHNKGKERVGVYLKHIAYEKRKKTLERALNEGQPLRVVVEPLGDT